MGMVWLWFLLKLNQNLNQNRTIVWETEPNRTEYIYNILYIRGAVGKPSPLANPPHLSPQTLLFSFFSQPHSRSLSPSLPLTLCLISLARPIALALALCSCSLALTHLRWLSLSLSKARPLLLALVLPFCLSCSRLPLLALLPSLAFLLLSLDPSQSHRPSLPIGSR